MDWKLFNGKENSQKLEFRQVMDIIFFRRMLSHLGASVLAILFQDTTFSYNNNIINCNNNNQKDGVNSHLEERSSEVDKMNAMYTKNSIYISIIVLNHVFKDFNH